jgi:hypothetical protein
MSWGMVRPRGPNCTKPVPGGKVVATARDVKEPKEAKLTIRLKFKTKERATSRERLHHFAITMSGRCASSWWSHSNSS